MIDLRRPRRSRDGKASQSGSASCTLLDSVTCLAASSSRRCISLFHQRLVGCTSNRSSKRCRSSLKLERDACSNGVGGKTSPGIPCKRCSHRSATAASYAPSAKERRVGTANVVVGREGDHLSTTHCVCSEKRDVASTTILEGSVQKERERERERERRACRGRRLGCLFDAIGVPDSRDRLCCPVLCAGSSRRGREASTYRARSVPYDDRETDAHVPTATRKSVQLSSEKYDFIQRRHVLRSGERELVCQCAVSQRNMTSARPHGPPPRRRSQGVVHFSQGTLHVTVVSSHIVRPLSHVRQLHDQGVTYIVGERHALLPARDRYAHALCERYAFSLSQKIELRRSNVKMSGFCVSPPYLFSLKDLSDFFSRLMQDEGPIKAVTEEEVAFHRARMCLDCSD